MRKFLVLLVVGYIALVAVVLGKPYLFNSQSNSSNVPVYLGMVLEQSGTGANHIPGYDYVLTKAPTVRMEVRFENPKDYNIESFMVNTKKFVREDFIFGFNNESVLVEVPLGLFSGNITYYINDIKYSSKNKLYDVEMVGKGSIKCLVLP